LSVAEIAPRNDDFERTPPHDVAAEQCVLGGMLLSKDAISDVIEVIRPTDHYRPAHQLVHEAILDLYGRGEPADAITVANELTRRGEIARVGGGVYLHTLIASVPTAANAGYYARIVRERAILRRLVEAGTRIVQFGYAGDADADDLVDRAQAEVYAVTDRRTSEDYHSLSEIMPGALDEIEAIGSRGGVLTGVPTGFSDLDTLTNGLHPGQMVVIAARPAMGKALALDTPLPTPAGWTTMGEVRVGDHLLGSDGKPTRVVAATEVMHGRPCYEVEFDDGEVIVADANHQWQTTTRAARRQQAERHTAWYWSKESRLRLRAALQAAWAEPDRSITAAEVLRVAGSEFRSLMHTVGRGVGFAAERIPVLAAGPKRTYEWKAPAYSSRRALLGAMVQQADRPKNESTTAVHERTMTTAQIASTLRHPADGRLNHAVALAAAVDLSPVDLPLPPYTLGIWLGDGTSRSATFTSADPQVAEEIEADGLRVTKSQTARLRYTIRFPESPPVATRACAVCGLPFIPKTSQVRTCGRVCGGRSRSARWRTILGASSQPMCPDCGKPSSGFKQCQACRSHHGTVQAVLRTLDVLGNKHIPAIYLRSSQDQRRALLAGLLDSDGTVTPTGSVQFAVTSRRLAEDVRELVVSLGYRCGWSQKRVRGASADSSIAYTITFTTADDVFRLNRKRTVHRERRPVRTTPRTRQRFITAVRPIESVPVRCVQVDNADHMYLASRSMIPTHNSTLALDFARAAAIRNSMSTVFFSLEMGRNEITMRLLSAEARVPLQTMRTGQMNDDDWARLARRMSEVADAPLFIDDSPNMSMMEIRAKCRRLKQRNDLKFVIIDYLQLMSSPKRVENRQQEVSEMSRSLKLLAKEIEVPVIALSQLNRGPEQRTDKKPLLSDLRESGCLTADTRILRADTGSETTLGDLLASGEKNVLVWSMDDRLRLVPRIMTHAFPSGVKEVFRVRLTSGREVQATANHPFLTLGGWRPLGELKVGSRVGISRQVPTPLDIREAPEPELVMLAHLLGDGSFVRNQPIRYASTDEENLTAVIEAARHFGITAIRDDHPAARCTSLRLPAPYRLARGRRNPVAEWLDSMGLFGLRSHEKFLPQHIFSLPQDQLALFLRHLWATDGSVTVAKSGAVRIYYGTTSEMLARGLQDLLLRFGMVARLRAVGNTYGHPQWTVDIAGAADQLQFVTKIGAYGRRGLAMIKAQRRLEDITVAGRFDTIPSDVWIRVRHVMQERSISLNHMRVAIGTSSRGDLNAEISPSRSRIGRIAEVLGDADLEMLATNDVFWDTIASIESVGCQPVYDATVNETHNFVANGINLHNSIEQDADVVILLHREDAYERESPRAGEADLIVAKHRNGPTATVTVAFQGHYSRFVDMAPT
jgi:replicative DNA helicase